jgi:hypothetical protein
MLDTVVLLVEWHAPSDWHWPKTTLQNRIGNTTGKTIATDAQDAIVATNDAVAALVIPT